MLLYRLYKVVGRFKKGSFSYLLMNSKIDEDEYEHSKYYPLQTLATVKN